MFDYSPPPAADALKIIRRLQAEGFTAYFAGGCVRDGLLGRPPKDFDVATDATPDSVRKIFGQRRTLAFGASFGVIGVQGTAPQPTEVATFRHDGTYSDGRRPDHVRFGTAEEDALRRDYTINGLFYDPVQDQVIDFVGGRADLAQRLIRAIGDPKLRIGEDKLRMLRAVRFAAALGFAIDASTAAAIREAADEVTVTSGERIGAEMRRMLGSPGAAVAIELLADTGLLKPVWPGLETSPTALQRAIRLAGAIQPPDFAVCVAAVLTASAIDPVASVEELSQHWRWSTDERKAIELAIRHRETILAADQHPWSVIQPLLMLPQCDTLLALADAWAIAEGCSPTGVQYCRQRLATWSPEALDPPPLLTGKQLIELGYRPGRSFKQVLQTVRDLQLDGQLDSSAAALALAQQILGGADA